MNLLMEVSYLWNDTLGKLINKVLLFTINFFMRYFLIPILVCSSFLFFSSAFAQRRERLSVIDKAILFAKTLSLEAMIDTASMRKTGNIIIILTLTDSLREDSIAKIHDDIAIVFLDFVVYDSTKKYNKLWTVFHYESDTAYSHPYTYADNFSVGKNKYLRKEYFSIDQKFDRLNRISNFKTTLTKWNDTLVLSSRITVPWETIVKGIIYDVQRVSRFVSVYVVRGRKKQYSKVLFDIRDMYGKSIMPLCWDMNLLREQLYNKKIRL